MRPIQQQRTGIFTYEYEYLLALGLCRYPVESISCSFWHVIDVACGKRDSLAAATCHDMI